jgi:hypothetical protein
MMMLMPGMGHGHYDPRYYPVSQNNYDEEYMNEIDAKEAALKGFVIGLALGFGALGSLLGFLKLIWIPLFVLGALLPLLIPFRLPLTIPITTGKMLVGAIQNNTKGVKNQSKLQVYAYLST